MRAIQSGADVVPALQKALAVQFASLGNKDTIGDDVGDVSGDDSSGDAGHDSCDACDSRDKKEPKDSDEDSEQSGLSPSERDDEVDYTITPGIAVTK